MKAEAKKSEYQQAIATTRKLAQSQGIKPGGQIDSAYLAAGIAKSLGEEVGSILDHLNLAGCREGLDEIESADATELEALPAVAPDAGLKSLLRSELGNYRSGGMTSKEALEILLSKENVRVNLARLLCGNAHYSQVDITSILRKLTKNLQEGYRLGSIRYGYLDSRTEAICDYGLGKRDREFGKALNSFYADKLYVSDMLYSANGKDSYFRGLLEQHGRLGADILLAVIVNSLTPYSSDRRLISIREIAWTLAPDRYHAIAAKVAGEVERLVQEKEIVEKSWDNEIAASRLANKVAPTRSALGGFCWNIAALEECDYARHPY